MSEHEHDDIRRFISILMESSLYMTLSLKERQGLLKRLANCYPFFEGEEGEAPEDHGG